MPMIQKSIFFFPDAGSIYDIGKERPEYFSGALCSTHWEICRGLFETCKMQILRFVDSASVTEHVAENFPPRPFSTHVADEQ